MRLGEKERELCSDTMTLYLILRKLMKYVNLCRRESNSNSVLCR